MKKYDIPEMKLSRFESESVVTQASGTQQTAMEQAKTAANDIEGRQKTFTVVF